MTFEELKKELKEIERQEALCERRYVRIRKTYKRQNAPIQQKKFIGNAVEVNMARVLCEALCKKLNQKKQAV